jgi:NifU-like protein involved in Fe-S cluster formation
VKKLKSMPPIKLHCSVLGIEALNKAIKDYETKK